MKGNCGLRIADCGLGIYSLRIADCGLHATAELSAKPGGLRGMDILA
jgi:hypothetical protein